MVEQRGTRISEMYVDILKGLKKRGTREEGRQDRIGKRSWEIGNGNLAPVPFTESRRLCISKQGRSNKERGPSEHCVRGPLQCRNWYGLGPIYPEGCSCIKFSS